MSTDFKIRKEHIKVKSREREIPKDQEWRQNSIRAAKEEGVSGKR